MAAQQLLKIVYALDIKFWVRWCTCSMWRMLLPYYLLFLISIILFLPAHASEQGNVIGSVRIYIYMCVQKKIVIERTRDLIYLKFVATDFFPKIISPSTGENSGDLA